MIKKILLLSLITLSGVFAYGQSAKQMLAEIDGHWELDDNNNVSIVKIVEVPDLEKSEIFDRALRYFTYNYIDGKATIQTQDRHNGLIISKGTFVDLHTSALSLQVDADNILRVDVKDGRARITASLTNFDQYKPTEHTTSLHYIIKVADAYPVNPKGRNKVLMTKAFYKAYHKAFETIEDMEKAIKDGNTSKEIENENW